ncbi:hypothetical protein G6F31_015830 [Rhizopus arrhizus]|nr:hypothetical protein G6F31_015830 [Rhizopus arrhizus]
MRQPRAQAQLDGFRAGAVIVRRQDVDVAQERCHERILRIAVELVGRGDLPDHALIHHGDAIRHAEGLALVMRDKDRRHAQPALDIADFHLHGAAQAFVQRGKWLVQQEDLGTYHQRPRQRHALLLPAGQFRGIALKQMIDMQARRHGADLFANVPFAAQLQRRRDVVVDRHRWVIDELLIDHCHIALAHGHAGHVHAVNQHAAFGGPVQPGHDAHQGGLAGQGHPQQHRHGARNRGQAHGSQVRLRAGSQTNPVQGQLHLVSSTYLYVPIFHTDFGIRYSEPACARTHATG